MRRVQGLTAILTKHVTDHLRAAPDFSRHVSGARMAASAPIPPAKASWRGSEPVPGTGSPALLRSGVRYGPCSLAPAGSCPFGPSKEEETMRGLLGSFLGRLAAPTAVLVGGMLLGSPAPVTADSGGVLNACVYTDRHGELHGRPADRRGPRAVHPLGDPRHDPARNAGRFARIRGRRPGARRHQGQSSSAATRSPFSRT